MPQPRGCARAGIMIGSATPSDGAGRRRGNRSERMAHEIMRPLRPEQQAAIDSMADVWSTRGKWPVFDYVRRTVEASGADLEDAMSRMPTVRGPSGNDFYRLFFTNRGWPLGASDEPIGLTVAGLHLASRGRLAAAQVVRVIGFLADEDALLVPDPERVVSLDIPVIDLLSHHLRDDLRGLGPETLMAALEHEPPLWGAVNALEGRIRPEGRRLRHFRGVTATDDYLARLVRWFGAEGAQAPSREVRSPLALPEALGYLDAVWRARIRSPLLGRTRPAAVAKIILPCGNADEFDARLSAIADLLGQMEVALNEHDEAAAVKAGERSLARLRRRLRRELASGPFSRVSTAVGDLQAIVRIRVSGQHSDTGGQVIDAFQDLGLRYPPPDWGAAWDAIRGRCVDDINAIREELEASLEP
ncbi:MAG: hypothetical protein C0498_10740 [Anaerolinea sp.]|nr:hypothetical protein [Anaerolinea sp.]